MFYVAVAVTAWFGGVWPALVALLLGCLAGWWFFLPPRGALAIMRAHDALEAGVYLFVGVTVALLVESMRRAQRRADEGASAARAARSEAERALGALARVHAITEAALADLPLQESLGEMVRRVRDSLRTDTAVILMDEQGVLRVRAAIGLEPELCHQVSVPNGKFADLIAKEGRPLVWDDVDYRGVMSDYLRQRGIRSLAGVPLTAGGRVVGVLHVGTLRPRKFQGDEVHLLQIAAERVALAMERAARVDEERRARREAESANRAKDDFLAMLSHELRNPLTPIRTAIRLLRVLGPPDPKLHHARDIIDRQISHMVRLVDDLLDASRITRGKITLEKAPVRLGDVIAQAVEMVRPLIDRKAHELGVEVPPESIWLEADEARLVQAVSNLLTNATKFTPTGGTITLTAGERNGKAVLSVRDTGIGIAVDALDRVFEPFVQEDVTLERQQSGLGVGLTLAKRLVEMHGGESRYGARARVPGANSRSPYRRLRR
jgi:signal transduction histidine kinase